MKKSKLSIWFYLLVAYVLIQFSWWTYLLIDLNHQILTLKQGITNSTTELNQLQQEFIKSVYMIVGEGSVFLILLLLGIIQTKKAITKEVHLARKQQNFLSAITHELKTPIASIKLFLETLLKRKIDENKKENMLKSALEESNRLNQLTDNLLLTTQIDFSNYRVNKKQTDLSELTEKITQRLSKGIGKERITRLKLNDQIRLKTDENAYTSILTNLYENAVKYSDKNSSIAVTLNQNNEQVTLQIIDEGSGVNKHEKNKIFDKFYRAGNENIRKTKGTGLGLYIVKELCFLLGASIVVKNNPEKGATFEVNFS